MVDLREMLGPSDYEELANFVAFIRPEDILYSGPLGPWKKALGKGTIKPEAMEWLHKVNLAQWAVLYPHWTKEKRAEFALQLPLDRK